MRSSYVVVIVALSATAALLWWRLAPDEPAPDVPEPPITDPPAASAPAPSAPSDPVSAPAAAAPADPAAEKTDGDDPMVIRSEADLNSVLDGRGLEGLMTDIGAWGAKRGYPRRDDAGNLMLEQPYEQYDDETLRGLAMNGDMWAQQFLAERLEDSRPGEASEWYRKAAVAGSVYAMTQLGMLYNRIASLRNESDFDADSDYLSQTYAMKDSVDPSVQGYAWMAVAEIVGWDPVLGATASPMLRRRLNDDQVQEACDLARGLRDDLAGQRAQLGLGDYDRAPPPLVLSDSGSMTDCDFADVEPYDLAGCREVTVESQQSASSVWLCDQD